MTLEADRGVAFAGRQARPRLHYTPPAGWLNDPNGLAYADGTWHLCYQHHPASAEFGAMHWGHAVSADLVSWHDMPTALRPDEHGLIFSGSAVVDHGDTAGFGVGALVAIYTQFTETTQVQSIAGSTDGGRTWKVSARNPVLGQPHGIHDFRDPKVIWFDTPAGGHWVMVLAVGAGVRFYVSANLHDWELTGVFEPERGRPYGVWETPDLFELAIDGTDRSRWVLPVGAAENAPAGGSGTRYWTGTFDGEQFTADGPAQWADWGADFYAAQSWSDAPAGRRVWIAWMSNWAYAADVPAVAYRSRATLGQPTGDPPSQGSVVQGRVAQGSVLRGPSTRETLTRGQMTRGQMTLPRELALRRAGGGEIVLAQRPVAEIDEYLADTQPFDAADPVELESGAALVRVRCDAGQTPTIVTIRGQAVLVRVTHDPRAGVLQVERDDHYGVGNGFATVHTARLDASATASDEDCVVDVVIDRASVEVFAHAGRLCFTELTLGLGGSPSRRPARVTVHGGVESAEVRHTLPLDPADAR